MKIFISPAKKMRTDRDFVLPENIPCFIDDTKIICEKLKEKTFEELKELFKCSDTIARENFSRYKDIDLFNNLTCAIYAYDGIQYQYMAPNVLSEKALSYIDKNLRILSGFYGILKPFDGVTPYRLEMQNKLEIDNFKNLYKFWGDKIYREIIKDDKLLLNLASKEYSKVITPFITEDVKIVDCYFYEEDNGKLKEKGVYAKMARGEMVRYLAENNIEDINKVKEFDVSSYRYSEDLSDENKYVFVKGK